MISFTMECAPVPKERARVVGKASYTPKRTRDFEYQVGMVANGAMRNRDLFRAAVSVVIVVSKKMPVGWPKNVRNEMLGKPCVSTNDIENISKSICDALNGIVYCDDRQISALNISRFWGGADCFSVTVDDARE